MNRSFHLLWILLFIITTCGYLYSSPRPDISIENGKLIIVSSDSYAAILVKNGILNELFVNGVSCVCSGAPLLSLKGYRSLKLLPENAKFVSYKINKNIENPEIIFTTKRQAKAVDKNKSEAVIEIRVLYRFFKNKIEIIHTITPDNEYQPKWQGFYLKLSEEMYNARLEFNNGKSIQIEDSYQEKYKSVMNNFTSFSMFDDKKRFTGPVKLEFLNSKSGQIGENRDTIQIENKGKSDSAPFTPRSPLVYHTVISTPAGDRDSKIIEKKIILNKGKIIRKLNDGLFAITVYNFVSKKKPLLNNFNDNEKEVKLVKEAGIPVIRLQSIYANFGIADGWTRRKPYDVDPIYPKKGGPLNTEFIDRYFTPIRDKMNMGMVLCLGQYNPSFSKHIPGTRLYFRAVTDYDDWTSFAVKFIEHAKKEKWNVKVWQIWNEANVKSWWEGSDFNSYIEFYKAIVPVLKKKFPDIKVSGPVLAGGIGGNKGELIEAFLAGIGDTPCDYIDWHNYGFMEKIPERVAIVRALLKKYGREHTGIFISEFNTRLGVAGSTVRAGLYQARAWYRMLYNGVDMAALHTLASQAVGTFPIIDANDWEPLPAYFMFKMLTGIIQMQKSDLTVPPQTDGPFEIISVVRNNKFYYLVIKTDSSREYKLTFDLSRHPGKKLRCYEYSRKHLSEEIPIAVSNDSFTKNMKESEALCIEIY